MLAETAFDHRAHFLQAPQRCDLSVSADTPPGQSRAAIATELAGLMLLKRTPTLLEVGNVAAFMASAYASPMTATVANISCGTIMD